tara:strand:+ start:97 stop:726 length:630 start_codon:yes stop_codon:yes gene_type:complete
MKVKKYLYYFAVIVFVTSCRTISIPNNKPLDNIVLVTGDTLYGKVDYLKERFVISKFYKRIRLIDTNGKKKKIKPKNVISYRVNGTNYESFILNEQTRIFSNGRFYDTRYSIDNNGTQHFLKVIRKGHLLYYELEWIDVDNNDIQTLDLVKKAEDKFFIRADNGIFGISKKVLHNYLSDCPKIQEKLMQKDFKWVFQVVDFYNENCVRE